MIIKITENMEQSFPFNMYVNSKFFNNYLSLTNAMKGAKEIFNARSEAFQIITEPDEKISINYLRIEIPKK